MKLASLVERYQQDFEHAYAGRITAAMRKGHQRGVSLSNRTLWAHAVVLPSVSG